MLNGITSSASAASLSQVQALRAGQVGAGPPPAPPSGPPPLSSEVASTITNDRGETLLDLEDELTSAIQSALEGLAEGEDPREAVKAAIDGALEANGFDLAEVQAAFDDARGAGPVGQRPPPPPPELARVNGGGANGGGPSADADAPWARASEGATEDLAASLVQGFLAQLRSGANVDVAA